MVENGTKVVLNISQVMQKVPHRYPFLLIDKVIGFEKDKRITAQKNVTINEPYFSGHFPTYPVMPGVLVIEALAQACGILTISSSGDTTLKSNEIYFFAGINNARFKRQVIPGDILILEVEMIKQMRGVSKYNAKATVDGAIAAEAELMLAKRDI